MCTSKKGNFLATSVSLTPLTGWTKPALASHSSGLESMNRTKSHATILFLSGLFLFTPHAHPYTMVWGLAGSTCGRPTTVKSFLIGEAVTCGVAQGPVIHMAVKPSRKSWFGLLAVFLVFLGSPHSLVTSRHRVRAFSVSALLRYAVLPSSL